MLYLSLQSQSHYLPSISGGDVLVEKQLDHTDSINMDCSANTLEASGLTESVLTTEAVALQCQNIACSKVSYFIF